MERFEQTRLLLGWDPGSRVADANHHFAAHLVNDGADPDLADLGETRGIRQQVDDNLAYASAIQHAPWQGLRHINDEFHCFATEQAADSVYCLADQSHQVSILGDDGQPHLINPRQIQDVVHQVQQVLGVLVYLADVAAQVRTELRLAVGLGGLMHHLGKAKNQVQRRPQLMADGGREEGLHPSRLFCLVARLGQFVVRTLEERVSIAQRIIKAAQFSAPLQQFPLQRERTFLPLHCLTQRLVYVGRR